MKICVHEAFLLNERTTFFYVRLKRLRFFNTRLLFLSQLGCNYIFVLKFNEVSFFYVNVNMYVFIIAAQHFELPHLSAYLNSMGTNFSHGANFATAGSPIRPAPCGLNGYSPFILDLQFNQFAIFKNKTQLIRQQGNII